QITPAAISGVTLGNGSFVYDGTEKILEITGGLPEGADVTYTNNGRTDAGSQIVTATIGGGHYEALVLTAELTVTPATRGLDFPALPERMYGDSPFALTASSNSGEAVSYVSSNPSVAAVSATGEVTVVG